MTRLSMIRLSPPPAGSARPALRLLGAALRDFAEACRDIRGIAREG